MAATLRRDSFLNKTKYIYKLECQFSTSLNAYNVVKHFLRMIKGFTDKSKPRADIKKLMGDSRWVTRSNFIIHADVASGLGDSWFYVEFPPYKNPWGGLVISFSTGIPPNPGGLNPGLLH